MQLVLSPDFYICHDNLSKFLPYRIIFNQLQNSYTGIIGYPVNTAVDLNKLICKICIQLKEAGCTEVIGPIDQSTWHTYRLTSETKGQIPSFPGEPPSLKPYKLALEKNLFTKFVSYQSVLETDFDYITTKCPKFSHILIREANLSTLHNDLKAVHQMCLQAFKQQPYFEEIGLEEFLTIHNKTKEITHNSILKLAEFNGKLVGFIYAYFWNYELGDRVLIVKTLARCPGRFFVGLGRLLLRAAYQHAENNGCTKVIHALMYDGNSSVNMHSPSGIIIRKYHLWRKLL